MRNVRIKAFWYTKYIMLSIEKENIIHIFIYHKKIKKDMVLMVEYKVFFIKS